MRVLIVDDHELFRAGLALLLTELFPDIELLHASTLSQGMNHALGELLNIVFLDLDLPDGNGCNALAELKESRPSLPVIVISADERVETISRCIQLRAMGYVPKSSPPEALRAAISAVLAGGVFLPASSIASLSRDMDADKAPANGPEDKQPRVKSDTSNASELGLTPREFETLAWLVRGLPSKAIAVRMGLEDITVRKYISHLLAHFNLRRRTELIVMLADRGVRLGVPPVTDPALDRSLPAAGGHPTA
ncbi:response regulator transcription factor [Paraburkholderia aspalathi]|uniref:response regulator transcription factor n=1 Tax=Paraburkholderia aspalathi TaxID=1324617 RepID=UPI00190CD47F|nr:response regulator transcription factor [Paraburkholderia aspalathi]MBK3840020.1 response regulator transcription factor [Paraburkholderia aspalathi]CAE6773137.1 DNA-binding transcriptional activator DevR/DosR [Paraburkholderia aspalathi]